MIQLLKNHFLMALSKRQYHVKLEKKLRALQFFSVSDSKKISSHRIEVPHVMKSVLLVLWHQNIRNFLIGCSGISFLYKETKNTANVTEVQHLRTLRMSGNCYFTLCCRITRYRAKKLQKVVIRTQTSELLQNIIKTSRIKCCSDK